MTMRTRHLSAWILGLMGGGCLLDAYAQPQDMRLIVGSIGAALVLCALNISCEDGVE